MSPSTSTTSCAPNSGLSSASRRCRCSPRWSATPLTVIRVTHNRRTRHQLYAVTDATWVLVAVFGNYPDALSELLAWRRYLGRGGTVAAWQLAHPDGVYPERSGF